MAAFLAALLWPLVICGASKTVSVSVDASGNARPSLMRVDMGTKKGVHNHAAADVQIGEAPSAAPERYCTPCPNIHNDDRPDYCDASGLVESQATMRKEAQRRPRVLNATETPRSIINLQPSNVESSEQAAGAGAARDDAVIASMTALPSRSAVESLWSRVQSKHPSTCDPEIVQQECDRISAEDLASILRLPERAVNGFYDEAGLAGASAGEPTCQDVCKAALQAVPARNRPPLHYVAAQQVTSAGDIEWAVDLTPIDLRAPSRRAPSREGGGSRPDEEHDVDDVHAIPDPRAGAQAMPSFDRQDTVSTLEVATRVCEMFRLYPWTEPAVTSSFIDEVGNATRYNSDGSPIPDLDGMFMDCTLTCSGLAHANNCRWRNFPNAYFPCCRCWRKRDWNAEMNMLWGHAKSAVMYAVWRLPSLEAAKERLVPRFFGFEYTRSVGWFPTEEKRRAVANTEMLDWWVQYLWWKINDASVVFCYDAALSPPGHSWGLGWGSQTNNTIAFSEDGWIHSTDPERVRTMLHEYYHTLGPRHGEIVTLWGVNHSGPLLNAYKMDCYLTGLLEELRIIEIDHGRCKRLQNDGLYR